VLTRSSAQQHEIKMTSGPKAIFRILISFRPRFRQFANVFAWTVEG
jgi:hypothetical protein